MSHWKAEQIPYGERYRNLTPSDVLHLYKANITWSNLNRWDYSDASQPSPPPYTMYTGLSLTQYFIGFWIIFLAHVCSNIMIKRRFSEDFKKNCSSLLSMIVHGIENTNVPTVWKDWDIGKGKPEEHKKRHILVLKEMVATMIVRILFHTFMLCPVVYTGKSKTPVSISISKIFLL